MRDDIENIFFLIKNWKNKEIYLEEKLYQKYLIEYREFVSHAENRIKRILNYSYGNSFDFVLNDDNRAYITYYPLEHETKSLHLETHSIKSHICSCTKKFT